MSLREIISEAEALANPRSCDNGHKWKMVGGRQCPKDYCHCSQTVYVCKNCGETDYGEKGGPAWEECTNECTLD